MTPEQMELLKIIFSSISGGLMVKIVDWLANRGKNKADEIKTLQEFWHAEFERLEGEVKELRKELNGKELDFKEITTKYRELQKDYNGLQELLRLRTRKSATRTALLKNYLLAFRNLKT